MIPWGQRMAKVAGVNLATFGEPVSIEVGLNTFNLTGIPATSGADANVGDVPFRQSTHRLLVPAPDFSATGAGQGNRVQRGGRWYRIAEQPFDDGAGWVLLTLIEVD